VVLQELNQQASAEEVLGAIAAIVEGDADEARVVSTMTVRPKVA